MRNNKIPIYRTEENMEKCLSCEYNKPFNWGRYCFYIKRRDVTPVFMEWRGFGSKHCPLPESKLSYEKAREEFKKQKVK